MNPLIGITCFSTESPGHGSDATKRSAVNQQYVDAVAAAGGTPLCIPVGIPQTAVNSIYSVLDGLLLPGGVDVAPQRYGQEPHPNLGGVDEIRDDLELALASRALQDDLPILGICRGIQVLAVAAGGTLFQDLQSQVPEVGQHDWGAAEWDYLSHDIDLDPASRLAAAICMDSCRVNSFHHQAVLDVPDGFAATAWAPDGIIEAMEGKDRHFAVGIQCHPEALWQAAAPQFAGLFRAFVSAAVERASSRAA